MQTLARPDWRARRQAHRARLSPWVEAHRARRSRGEKHPVWDFLWEYYSLRPAQLLKWSPGFNVQLEAEASDWDAPDFGDKAWKRASNCIALDSERFPRHRLAGARATLDLLEATASRAPYHGCFGLHEWAMVYRCSAPRHNVALRPSAETIAELVETQGVRCSHYDAFRFFTPAARPRNLLQPDAENRAEFEQPGCIHASMDLYKHAYKFAPWIASSLVADAFELARDARWLDMRAAPYDLSAWNVEPIAIETAPGRAHYAAEQRQIAERAAPLRARLIEAYRALAKKARKPPAFMLGI